MLNLDATSLVILFVFFIIGCKDVYNDLDIDVVRFEKQFYNSGSLKILLGVLTISSDLGLIFIRIQSLSKSL